MFGTLPREAWNAVVSLHEKLKTLPNPRHRPPSLDTFAEQLFMTHAVAALKALDPRRKIRGDIAKQVGKHYGVSETWVFEARRSLNAELRAIIETHAAKSVGDALRFADPTAVEEWRKHERRRTDAT